MPINKLSQRFITKKISKKAIFIKLAQILQSIYRDESIESKATHT
ncbi:hypothetical protein GW12_19660 [Acinetobacter sp. HR7]|nr:hypothetical protein GW12_19660 [Acinetobacter sp. HR7]